ncbi:MAG: preprotein translocase subunit SecG [Oscillospiraceae bacterium]|nr:preprotein translocase subunit SecG [Oscillospiraceae bacterium]
MEVLKWVIIALQMICSIVLVAVITMQSGKEAGLSGALSGNSNSYLANSKKNNLDAVLASSTKWVGLVFVVLTLALSVL